MTSHGRPDGHKHDPRLGSKEGQRLEKEEKVKDEQIAEITA